ncbi:hypothetical protein ACHAP5_003829 [Fusarium lateritium]
MYHEKYYAPLYVDKSLNMSFRHCMYSYCTHRRGLAVAFHAECTLTAARFGMALTDCRSLTEYSYQPVSLGHGRRRVVIRTLIENALRKRYGKLSPELWHLISDDEGLIRLYTIAEISLPRYETKFSIDPSAPAWITCVKIDGIEYVSSLSNSPRAGCRQAWEPRSPSPNQFLYISSDYLGIRQIMTDPSRAKAIEKYPEYWKTVPVDAQVLLFTGDVSAEPGLKWPSTKST